MIPLDKFTMDRLDVEYNLDKLHEELDKSRCLLKRYKHKGNKRKILQLSERISNIKDEIVTINRKCSKYGYRP